MSSRGYGATAARLTPDQKVGSSNLSAFIWHLMLTTRGNKDFPGFPSPQREPGPVPLRRSNQRIPHGMAVSDQDGYRSDLVLSFVFGVTTFAKAAIVTIARADSTLGTSRAVTHPNTNRGLCRLPSEVERDPAHLTRYGRQRPRWVQVGPHPASISTALCEVSIAK